MRLYIATLVVVIGVGLGFQESISGAQPTEEATKPVVGTVVRLDRGAAQKVIGTPAAQQAGKKLQPLFTRNVEVEQTVEVTRYIYQYRTVRYGRHGRRCKVMCVLVPVREKSTISRTVAVAGVPGRDWDNLLLPENDYRAISVKLTDAATAAGAGARSDIAARLSAISLPLPGVTTTDNGTFIIQTDFGTIAGLPMGTETAFRVTVGPDLGDERGTLVVIVTQQIRLQGTEDYLPIAGTADATSGASKYLTAISTAIRASTP